LVAEVAVTVSVPLAPVADGVIVIGLDEIPLGGLVTETLTGEV
jgi:hypothetical protein